LLLAKAARGCYKFVPERLGVGGSARAFHQVIFLPVGISMVECRPASKINLGALRNFSGEKFRAPNQKPKTSPKPKRARAQKIMNNPNPFVPKGSLLEQQSQRRSRLKLAVFCVLAVSVTGLVAMLIQGCKREKPSDELNPQAVDTNAVAMDANRCRIPFPIRPVVVPPVATNPPVVRPAGDPPAAVERL
jgi:hypothetical protein